MTTNSVDLTSFYDYVQSAGELRSTEHAKRWTRAVLQELGHNLPKGAKSTLVSSLPEPLGDAAKKVFHLAFFPNSNLSLDEFASAVARRGGNTDPRFARFPIKAVFGGIQQFLSSDETNTIRDGLSPELRTVWDQAVSAFKATI